MDITQNAPELNRKRDFSALSAPQLPEGALRWSDNRGTSLILHSAGKKSETDLDTGRLD
jgi:hypothetical protein